MQKRECFLVDNSKKTRQKRKATQRTLTEQYVVLCSVTVSGNALARVQRVHEPADLWDITFCTRLF